MDQLQSDERLESPPDSETIELKNQIFLDTKSVCFFCLQENNIESDSKLKSTSLQNIRHYLNINPFSKEFENLKKKLKDAQGKNLFQNKCNFSVLLCARCAGFAQNLSSWIEKLETIQLHILHNLKLLQATFCEQSRYIENGVEWDQVKEKMGFSSDNSTELELLRELRDQIKERCGIQLCKFSEPQVRVCKIKDKTTESPSNDSAIVTLKLDKMFDKFTSGIATNSINPEPALLALLLERVVKFCRQLQNPPAINKQYIYCPLCKAMVSNSQLHFIHAHADKIFQAEKAKVVSETKFKLFCKQVITALVDRSQPAPTNSYNPCNKSIMMTCCVCKKPCTNRNDLITHIVLTHYKTVSRNLKDLQEMTESENNSENFKLKILPVKKPCAYRKLSYSSDNSVENTPYEFSVSTFSIDTCFKIIREGEYANRYWCSLCPGLTKGRKNREQIVHHHLYEFFCHKKQAEISEGEFKDICKSVMIAETRNLAPIHNTNKVRCVYCDGKQANKVLLKYHLLIEHHSKLEEKIEKCQKEKLIQNAEAIAAANKIVEKEVAGFKIGEVLAENKGKSTKFVYDRISQIMENYKHGESDLQCPVCKTIFTTLNNGKLFRAHLTQLHPELMFSSIKCENLSERHFQTICSNVLEEGVQEGDVPGKVFCAHCQVLFSTRQYVKTHMINVHFEILKEKMMKAQEGRSQLGPSELTPPSRSTFLKNLLDTMCNDSRQQDRLICGVPQCNKVFLEQKPDSGTLFRRHVGNKHPELVFECVKSSKLTVSEFKAICEKVLKSEMTLCGEKMFCRYCEHPNNQLYFLKFHLEMYHFDLLKEKIEKAQEEVTKKKISQIYNKPCPASRKRRIETVESVVSDASGDDIEIKIERVDDTYCKDLLLPNIIPESDTGESNDAVPIVKQECVPIVYENGNTVEYYSSEEEEGTLTINENGTDNFIEVEENDWEYDKRPELLDETPIFNVATTETNASDPLSVTNEDVIPNLD